MPQPAYIPPTIEPFVLQDIVRNALREDIGSGDVTTNAVVPVGTMAVGTLEMNANGLVAGLPVVMEVFRQIDAAISVECLVHDGSCVARGDVIARIPGPARSILIGERVALNFLQRMSGTATLTAEYVARVAGTNAFIADTRKTTPGLRPLERYAVLVGGGHSHRAGLSHAVLIKDNHIVAAGGIREAVARATRAVSHTTTVTVECETLEEVEEAIEAGADIVLLDNMTNVMRKEAVQIIGHRAITEASGGVTLDNVAEVAATGVDCISVGALTHSAPALDIRLNLSLQ